MSYDLAVYGRKSLSELELIELVTAIDGLDVDKSEPPDSGITVVRGTRRQYTFTVDGPDRIELEDIPESVTDVLLGASHLYNVLVEGSSPAAIPHAVRFARRLAKAVDGVVEDQQLGELWPRKTNRAAPRPAKDSLIAIVDLTWYALRRAQSSDVAARYLAVCRRYLPEALPRRFGDYEPLQHKLSEGGDQDFIEASNGASMLFFNASRPCIDDSFTGSADVDAIQVIRLSLHREPLREPAWRHALQHLFVAFAEQIGCFHATAEVVRGISWSGRSLWYGPEAERTTYLAPRGQWKGLSPYPTWWSWYSTSYADLVLPHLAADQLRPAGGGIHHQWAEEPVDRDQITRQLPVEGHRFWRKKHASWLPRELLAIPDTTDPLLHNPPLTPALRVPDDLRSVTG